MGRAGLKCSLKGFVKHFEFVHRHMPDHRYAWILGAGASRPSGIPTGGQLVDHWLAELYERESDGKVPLEEWATEQCLSIEGFRYQDRSKYYADI